MPSFKSRMFNFVMRNRHLLNGKLKREVFDENTSIQEFRDLCEKGAAKTPVAEGVHVQPEDIPGIVSEWLIPEGVKSEKMILYVHGGGYVSGSCSDHRGIISKFVKTCGVKALLYEYRLAPEHPFPAGLEDSVKTYHWLLDKGCLPQNIVITGESAGGGLALALLLALKERDLPIPKAAVAISPWTDLTCSSESYLTKNKVSVAPKNSWTVFAKHYTAGHPADAPLVSPLFGDLTGLPPILIVSGADDELFEDGEKFALKAMDADVDVIFKAGHGMVHCYPLLAPLFREATEAMDGISKFIRSHLELE